MHAHLIGCPPLKKLEMFRKLVLSVSLGLSALVAVVPNVVSARTMAAGMHNTVPTMAIGIVVSAVAMDAMIAEAIMRANAGLRIVVGSKKGVAAMAT